MNKVERLLKDLEEDKLTILSDVQNRVAKKFDEIFERMNLDTGFKSEFYAQDLDKIQCEINKAIKGE